MTIQEQLADLREGAQHLEQGYLAIIAELQAQIVALEARLDERRAMMQPAEPPGPGHKRSTRVWKRCERCAAELLAWKKTKYCKSCLSIVRSDHAVQQNSILNLQGGAAVSEERSS